MTTTKEVQLVNKADTEPTPMTIIAQMVQAGGDPAQLEKMMDLQERWERNVAAKAFAAAMVACRRDLPRVVKDRHNQHTNSDFASAEAVAVKIDNKCLEHGLFIIVSEEPHEREGWVKIKAELRHEEGHVEYFYRSGPMDNKGPKGNPTKSELHGMQSTVSYLARNLKLSIFGVVVVGHDDDGNQGSGQPITQDQVKQLHDLLTQTDSDSKAFMKWAGVEQLADIMQGKHFNNCMAAVKAKVQK